MKNIIFNLFVALMVLLMSVSVCAEEKETTTYSFDYSQYNGGDPDDYQYSFDKENWTSERTWEVEVGKMYKLYVKYPDGGVGLVSTFVPQAEKNTSKSESKTSSASNEKETSVVAEKKNEVETEQSEITEGEVLNESEIQAVVSPGFVAPVLFGIIFVFVCILGSVYYIKKRKIK